MKIEKDKCNILWLHLSSGDSDYPGCRLSIKGFGYLISQNLPQWVLNPCRWSTQAWSGGSLKMVSERQYGFCFNEDHFSLRFGVIEDESWYKNAPQEKYWSFFIPWKAWRHVRHSIYTPEGLLFSDLEKLKDWKERRLKAETCPKVKFMLQDFDGEEVIATCIIEEREWRLGAGIFKWLGNIAPPPKSLEY